MKLPNAESSIVDIEKLRDYCLSLTHPRGRHKARVFQSVLGMSADHADELRAALIDAALHEDVTLGVSDEYGDRFIIDFELKRGELAAMIRSSRIVRKDETAARFITCYIL